VSGEPIPQARVDILREWGVPESEMTSIAIANIVVKPRKMIIVDDAHTHFFCSDVSDFGQDLGPDRQENDNETDPNESDTSKDKITFDDVNYLTAKHKKMRINYDDDEI